MATQHRGRIKTWKDDKGFGFITPDDKGGDVFFHVRDVAQRQTRPSANMTVFYTLSHDAQQRPRAINVRFVNQPRVHIAISLCVAGIFFLVLVLATLTIPITPWILALYALSSAVTYGLYALDKASAIDGARRIPESTLHLLELVGGWPGALVAQERYRHKTAKASYQIEFWLCVAGNLVCLIGYCCFRLFRT